jgi:PPP family 3-phenylpropionic acid transporter
LELVKDKDQLGFLPKPRESLPILRILYFFYFAAFGIIITFLNVYYWDIGLTGVQIGLLSFVMPLVSIVAAPLWGIWNDRIGQVKRLLIIACVGIIFTVMGIGLAEVFFWLVIFTILFAFFDSSILPILDSTTLRFLGRNRDKFGRERVWGSIGFIIAVWGIGFVLQRFGSRWFFPFYILMILSVLITLKWLPNQKANYKPAVYANISKLILQKEWLLFSASLLLVGLGNFAVSGFLGIYIKDLGEDEGLVGMAAAFATLTELPIMFWGNKILKRFGSWRLLLVAYGAISIRLVLYAIMPDAWWVLPISLLNSLTFGVYWIATVAYVDQMASDEIKSSAQGMLYAVLNVSRMIAALLSGYLYDLVGGGNLFLISALFSLFAIILFWFNKPVREPIIVDGGVI